jgi:hypothetical protein
MSSEQTLPTVPQLDGRGRHAAGVRGLRQGLAALVLAAVVGAGGAFAQPQQASAAGRYQVDLFRSGDFVAQTNLYQCVGASMQMMINMVAPRDDRSATTQHELWQLSRRYSPPRPGGIQRRGSSVWGWAEGLNQVGYGPYVVVGFPSIEEATRGAARAIARTGKPVGLLVWRGRHAWVMSGFLATADPLETDDFAVTHVDVLDPLYPRSSSAWGKSPPPGSRISLATLGEQFVQRRFRPGNALNGQWVIVMPATIVVPAERDISRLL